MAAACISSAGPIRVADLPAGTAFTSLSFTSVSPLTFCVFILADPPRV
jgi:hypothetical protein